MIKTVNARYLEHLLLRTFTISNFLTGSLNFSSNSRLKNICYLEIRYLELSLSRTNYLVPLTVFCSLSRTFARIFKLECSNNVCIFSSRFFVVSTWQSKESWLLKRWLKNVKFWETWKMAFSIKMLQKNMGCWRILFQRGLKIKKNLEQS